MQICIFDGAPMFSVICFTAVVNLLEPALHIPALLRFLSAIQIYLHIPSGDEVEFEVSLQNTFGERLSKNTIDFSHLQQSFCY